MAFCLPKFAADALIKALPEDISKLTDMTSAERRDFFSKVVGEENATQLNTQFESKLILKDQQRGLINWVKKTTGMTPEAKRSLIDKVNKMEKVLQPEDKQMFLEDLAAHKLGFGVTIEESGRIVDMAKKVEDAKSSKDRMDYGRAVYDFNEYVNQLKLGSLKTTIGEKVYNFAGSTKSIKASLDNSAVLRQGWKAAITNPKVWGQNAVQSFGNIVKKLGGKDVKREMQAEIVSRPTYDKMSRAKLDVGNLEEAYPTSLPEKIPLFGKLFSASETGFTTFLHKLRADLFDKYIEIAEKSGVDTNSKAELLSIGRMVNSLTGRADLGRIEPVAGVVNNVFFSPRFVKSHFDVLTAHQLQKNVTPFVRKQASLNLLKIITAQAAIMGIANLIQPGSAETDPRSSDFGKVKSGDTRFDVSGGSASLVTLAARLLAFSTKSSTTGVIKPLNTGEYGATDGTDVVYNFFESKLSPIAAVIRDIYKGKTFSGEKPTIANQAANLFVPLPIQNPIQAAKNENAANMLLIMIADGIGIGASTYAPKK
jgi:hypothetical protein